MIRLELLSMLRLKTLLPKKQTDSLWILFQCPVIPPSGAARVTKLQTPTRDVFLHHSQTSGQLRQTQALSTLPGAAANCSLCPALFMGQGSQKQQAELPSAEQDMGHAKKGKGGQRAHPVRRRNASLNSALAEKMQVQSFRQPDTPGKRKGWSLPRAEVQMTPSDWDRKCLWIDTQWPRSSHS